MQGNRLMNPLEPKRNLMPYSKMPSGFWKPYN